MTLQIEPAGSSAKAVLSQYWADAAKAFPLEWGKWINLNEIALMAKRNLFSTELTKITEGKETNRGRYGGGNGDKGTTNVLNLALGMAARKQHPQVTNNKHRDNQSNRSDKEMKRVLLKIIRKNDNLVGFNFSSRKQ